jgi:subtilisin family serine protease
MTVRRWLLRSLTYVALALMLWGGLFWCVGLSRATAAPPLASGGDPDCVALSQQGQETLLTAMTALLGDDPAGSQFSDDTAFLPQELVVGSTLADLSAIDAADTQFGVTLDAVGNQIVVGDLAFQRFIIGGDPNDHANTVRRVVCEIDKLRAGGILSATAYAEPNYRISASQWWAAGSQWRDDNLSQYMQEHFEDRITDFAAYETQWAWGADGINLRVNGSRTISQTGLGTRVVVFDSSPFAETGRVTLTANVADQEQALFGFDTQDRLPQFTFSGSAFPDHGVFVAGLVNAVAPAAQLELVRVLGNDDGRGTLFDLLAAVQQFYDRNGTAESLDLHGTVLNLSVGVHHPITPTFPSLTPTDTFGLPSEVQSLKQLLRYGYDKGALIVAASGNDFAFGQPDSSWTETPADYDFVISVGGSNSSGARSCFSNNGDLFAPAGEGDPGCSGPPDQRCATTPTDCIISVIHEEQEFTNAAFGSWVGSSFAAPQVSGLAALVLEALTPEVQQAATADTVTPPQKITAVLACGATTGSVNVIDVAKALSPDCLALGQSTPGQIRFARSAVNVLENSGTVTLTVQRVGGSDGAVRILANTFDGTATVGQDYPATSLDIDFADGQTVQTVAFPIFDDSDEESPETFIVRLGTVIIGDATVAAPSEVIVTILDDETTAPQLATYLPLVQR